MFPSELVPSNDVAATDGREVPTRPYRLLFVTARYVPFVGGTEVHTAEVAKRLAARGYEVTVLTADADGRPVRETIDGVEIIRVRGYPRGRDYRFAPVLRSVIQQGDWDLVHCQGYHTAVAPLAMYSTLRRGLPLVVTFHSGGHSSRLRRALRPVQTAALRPLLSRADRLIGVSKFETGEFERKLRLPADRFATVPSGTSLPVLPADDLRSSSRTVVCSVGRLEKYKGHHRMISALPHLRRALPDARLVIIGSGPYEGRLRKLGDRCGVAEHIEFISVPSNDRQEMARLLRDTSLVVLLSDYESQGLAAYEALASSRPVLLSNTAALGELATELGVRSIPPDAEPAELARAVHQAILERPVDVSGHLLEWDEIVTMLEDVYRTILKRQ